MPQQPRMRRLTSLVLVMSLIWLITPSTFASAQDSLKVIDNPGGGRVVYGPVVNQNTPQTAMAAVLRDVHTYFGDSPVVSKVFQSRDGQNFGAFFTLTAKSRGNEKIAGLVIVSVVRGAAPAGAVLYDDSSRFATTEPVLLHMLTDAWRTASTPSPASGTSDSGSVPAYTHRLSRWQRCSQPARRMANHVCLTWLREDHGPARGNRAAQQHRRPDLRPEQSAGTGAASLCQPQLPPILCPDSNALNTYLCVVHRAGPQTTVQLKNSRPIPTRGMAVQAVLIDADLDLRDGRGLMSCELGLSVTAVNALGSRTLGVNGTCAPQSSAAAEQPTLKAIYDSYSINGQVVAREFAGDERRSIQAGNNARIQANNAHAAEDAQAASFQAHMDNIDRFSRSLRTISWTRPSCKTTSRTRAVPFPTRLPTLWSRRTLTASKPCPPRIF